MRCTYPVSSIRRGPGRRQVTALGAPGQHVCNRHIKCTAISPSFWRCCSCCYSAYLRGPLLNLHEQYLGRLTVRKLTYTLLLPLPLPLLLPSFVLLPRLLIFDLPVFPSLSILLPLDRLYLDDPVFAVTAYIVSVSGSIGSVLDRDIGLFCSTVPTLSLRSLAAARHCTLTSHHIESIRTTSRPSFVQNRSSRDVWQHT
ncbi:hypothetical protein CSHISOI_08732 [Colletotrichum shisoi]|uniref:Uncharacterized protein n=1 Tax=Colletotrichum shisoi TaxID=2078593 RepID=A0A5Q4BJI0_9PEZI|nr:hypothetical protein CSHISOI_08732 [Colletotrichum shisoi]